MYCLPNIQDLLGKLASQLWIIKALEHENENEFKNIIAMNPKSLGSSKSVVFNRGSHDVTH